MRTQSQRVHQHENQHLSLSYGLSGNAVGRAPLQMVREATSLRQAPAPREKKTSRNSEPSISLRRDCRKQMNVSAVRGGKIYEKASSRRVRNRDALEKSGDAETAVALGSWSRKRSEQSQPQPQQQQQQSLNKQRRRGRSPNRISRRMPEVGDLEAQFAQKSFSRSAMIRDGLKRMRRQEMAQPRRHAVTASVANMTQKKTNRKPRTRNMVLPSHLQRAQQRRALHASQLTGLERQTSTTRRPQGTLPNGSAPKAPVSLRTAAASNDQAFAANVSAKISGLLDSDNESINSDPEEEGDEFYFMGDDGNDQSQTHGMGNSFTIDSDSGCSSDSSEQCTENGKRNRKSRKRTKKSNQQTKPIASKTPTQKTGASTNASTQSFPEEAVAPAATPVLKVTVAPPNNIKQEFIDLTNDDVCVKNEPETTQTTSPCPSPAENSSSSSHASVTQFLLDEGIGRNADRHEMEGYATEFLRLGLHSKSMIRDALLDKHYVPDPEPVVREWAWMKDFHKNVFLNWIRRQLGTQRPQTNEEPDTGCSDSLRRQPHCGRRPSFDL